MIMYTPALKKLKAEYPECEITFMTKYGNHEILQGLSYINNLIYIKRGKFMGRYRVLRNFWGQDAVIFTDWQPQLLIFAKLFHIPLRAGIPRVGHMLNDFLTYHIVSDVYKTEQYVARTHADMIEESLGITLEGDMTDIDVAEPTEVDVHVVDHMLHDIGVSGNYILLSPFSSMEQRDWPVGTAKEFVRKAENKFSIPVVVTGPADKVGKARTISKYNLIGKTSTMQLVELIRRARALVTPDSGPMHIAGAVGTRCIALFTKDLPSRWAPRNNCIPIYLNKPCSPCKDEVAKQCKHGVCCMKDISSDLVLDKIE